jgi:hypothetical protein
VHRGDNGLEILHYKILHRDEAARKEQQIMSAEFVKYISTCRCSVLGGSDAFWEVVADFHPDPREEGIENEQGPYLARQPSMF